MQRLKGLHSVAARSLMPGYFVEFRVRPKHLGMEQYDDDVQIFAPIAERNFFFESDFSNRNQKVTIVPVDTCALFSRVMFADDLIPIQYPSHTNRV